MAGRRGRAAAVPATLVGAILLGVVDRLLGVVDRLFGGQTAADTTAGSSRPLGMRGAARADAVA